MIKNIPPLQEKTTAILSECISSGNTDAWAQLLRSQPGMDGFAAIAGSQAAAQLFPPENEDTLDRWLLSVRAWRDKIEDPRTEILPRDKILYELWDRFSIDLADNLRRARYITQIPRHGGVLTFLASLTKCVVIKYSFHGLQPTLEPVAIIDSPRSLFDMWQEIDEADGNARNVLKSVLVSGHKLVMHRGILAHVDRRQEPGVFGPTIDTLFLNEIIADKCADDLKHFTPQYVLEVGTGSGLLSAQIAKHLSTLTELTCLDIDFSALSCTAKNVSIATLTPGSARRATFNYIAGPFDTSFFNRHFDLVICNPPYIPLPPAHVLGPSEVPDYFRAVGGTRLLEDLLDRLSDYLNVGGSLLLMVNNLSLDLAKLHMPEGCICESPLGPDGIEVLFDVEAVLSRPGWLKFLIDNKGLIHRDDQHFHRLHPLWITRNS